MTGTAPAPTALPARPPLPTALLAPPPLPPPAVAARFATGARVRFTYMVNVFMVGAVTGVTMRRAARPGGGMTPTAVPHYTIAVDRAEHAGRHDISAAYRSMLRPRSDLTEDGIAPA